MGIIILGIDPGTNNTGYGLVRMSDHEVECLDYGVISPPSGYNLHQKILFIHKGLKSLYKKYEPDHTAVEKVFLGKNPDAAFKIGYIFALCLLESETHGGEFFEYASRFVKKNVTFSGNASKELVQQFVTNFFSLKISDKKLDATDALAVALCHSRHCHKMNADKRVREKIAL